MARIIDDNNDNNLNILKSELLNRINEAKRDSNQIRLFVELLGRILTKTTERHLTNQHIGYVTTRLLDSQEKTMIGTGEGKSAAQMLLIAAEALLDKYNDTHFSHTAVIQRNLEDFQKFFENVGLKPELKSTSQGATLTVTSADNTLVRQVQTHGRLGR